MDAENQEQQTQETQEQTEQEQTQQQEETQQEGQEGAQEAKAPEATEEAAEAQTEGQEAAGEEAEEGEEKEEQSDGKGKHRRRGGWERRMERMERQLEEKDALIQSFLTGQLPGIQPQQQPAAKEEPPPPEVQAANLIQGLVQQSIAAERERERQASAAAELAKKEAEFRTAHEDYDDALSSFARARLPPSHLQALLNTSEPPAIMYALAKSPAELSRLRDLPPLQAALEIGRLAERLSASTASQPKPKQAARPPAPPTTRAGASASTAGDLASLPLSEYKRRMRSGGR